MKRNMLKVVAASLAGAMLLTACGGSGAQIRPAQLQVIRGDQRGCRGRKHRR